MTWQEAERDYTDDVIGETTIPRMFFDAVDRYEDMASQLYKGAVYDRSLVAADIVPPAPDGEYLELTYGEVADIVRNLAGGFRELGVTPDDRVSIYADTRMEWAQADMALMSAGAVVTTVYTESSPKQVEYLLGDPGSTGVVVENESLLAKVAEVESALDIEFAVLLDDVAAGDVLDADVYTIGEVHDLGAEHYDAADVDTWVDDRNWEDLSSLVYTSGTTGPPKGVKLSHKNWRTCLNQIRKRLGPRPDKPDDMPMIRAGKRTIAFLPLAHAFERANHFQNFASGISMGYAESTDTVADDIQQLEPQMAAAVPRVYERIYDSIREEAGSSAVGKRIFEWSIRTAQNYDRAENPGPLAGAKLKLADRLVFSKVREALGGEIEMFVSGGGSLSEELARLYRTMGIRIVEGYGMTETAPGVSFNPPEDIRVGTMGPPLVDVDVKVDSSIVSAETQASAEGEVGELLVKGPNVFEGYWNKDDKTAEAFDGEWFRTGDIVALDDDEYLRFVDREKNLIVLDTGKNVAPEPIEDEFSTSARVDQIMVIGDDEKFIAALIVPNFEQLRAWATEADVDLPEDPAAVIRDDRVRDWVAEDVDAVNDELPKHETIKKIGLVPYEWTADNELLTPSMKKKRRNIRDAYSDEIDTIYGRN